jgi:hypothetical protein
MPQNVSQVRYTEQEVEQIRSLFPDLDSVKLYRRYLLNLPLTPEEIERIQATWATPSARDIIIKTTVPVSTGNEAIGVGYDILNNIDINEHDQAYQFRRAGMFADAVRYLGKRIAALDSLPESATGDAKWLTAAIIDPSTDVDVDAIVRQLVVKQNIEGIVLGINAIINLPVETPEQAAARAAADSTE